MKITGHTGLYALFGSPVSHSGSPAMYNYGFRKFGIDAVYVAIDVNKEGIGEAISAARLFGIKGFNLTMPCKTEALSYVDEVSETAALVGAINTVVNEDGRLIGHITDGVGFVKNLEEQGIFLDGKKVTLFGAGGAATAIYVEALKKGISSLRIFSRKSGFFNRAEETVLRLKEKGLTASVRVCDAADLSLLKKEMGDSDIFINATVIGMEPHHEKSVIPDTAFLKEGSVVADIVYHPLETRLLKQAKKAGCRTVNGRGMLLWQGVEAFRLFTGIELPAEEIKIKFFS